MISIDIVDSCIFFLIKNGVTGSWTQGLVHAKHALYQLSYNPVLVIFAFIDWYCFNIH